MDYNEIECIIMSRNLHCTHKHRTLFHRSRNLLNLHIIRLIRSQLYYVVGNVVLVNPIFYLVVMITCAIN